MDPAEIINHHLTAFRAGDVDEVLADYAEGSLLLTSNGPIVGLEGLREFFTGLVTGMFQPGTYEIAIDDLEVEGSTALLVWHGTTQEANVPFAVDTFVVEGDKIALQTFAAKVEPK